MTLAKLCTHYLRNASQGTLVLLFMNGLNVRADRAQAQQ